MEVIAFHGKQQTGEVFRTKIDKFVDLLSSNGEFISWSFPDGPILLPSDESSRQMVRSWFDVPPTLDSFVCKGSPEIVCGFSQGGLMALATAFHCQTVRIAIVAGVPMDANHWLDSFLLQQRQDLDVYFFAGSEDTVVPLSETKALFERIRPFVSTRSYFEPVLGMKHQFPSVSRVLRNLQASIQLQWERVMQSDAIALQQEEMEVLTSIFHDMKICRPAPSQVGDLGFQVEIPVNSTIILKCTAQRNYPFGNPLNLQIINTTHELDQGRLLFLQERIKPEGVGEMQVFSCVTALQEALLEKLPVRTVEGAEVQKEKREESEEELFQSIEICTRLARERWHAAWLLPFEDDTRRGEWKLCVGLLGKPSAGKSTFFNVCTLRMQLSGLSKHAAVSEMGAQPFTTIDPHLGQASCEYRPGFHAKVLIKDVAGLVPGAYRGLGKGNRFLNDLLDASVLLHICDGSGRSDEGGNDVHTFTPNQISKDALWVLREIHLWIYFNVSQKWPTKANSQAQKRVCALFAGYHAPPCMVMRAATLAKLDLNLALQFSTRERHLLVACFLAVRFPVVLVLNKFDQVHDQAQSLDIVHSAVTAMGNMPSLVCQTSAKKEYLELTTNPESDGQANSGVQSALCKGIEAANPLVITAVCSDQEFTFCMFPNSQVYDLYSVCVHHQLLAGDFVRAEIVGGKTLSRDEYLREFSQAKVRIATNRKLKLPTKHVI